MAVLPAVIFSSSSSHPAAAMSRALPALGGHCHAIGTTRVLQNKSSAWSSSSTQLPTADCSARWHSCRSLWRFTYIRFHDCSSTSTAKKEGLGPPAELWGLSVRPLACSLLPRFMHAAERSEVLQTTRQHSARQWRTEAVRGQLNPPLSAALVFFAMPWGQGKTAGCALQPTASHALSAPCQALSDDRLTPGLTRARRLPLLPFAPCSVHGRP